MGREDEARTGRTTDVLHAQVLEHIDANLGDPARPGRHRARALHLAQLSVPAVRAGAPVSETIKAKRLERTRRDLADLALEHDSIFEIASR